MGVNTDEESNFNCLWHDDSDSNHRRQECFNFINLYTL